MQHADTAIELGAPRQRAVLAALLLRPNSVVTVDELIVDLWGEQPPGSPTVTLRSYISQLRKLLEPARESPIVLVSQAGGYRLAIDPSHVDVWQVKQLRELAGRHSVEQPQQARHHLHEALSLWSGEPLLGLPGPLMQRERDRLSELRLTLLEERLALDVTLAAPSELLPELQVLAADHPFRERLQGLLIRALHRQSRTDEARAVYDALHTRLVEHLGIEPGPELAALRAELDEQDQLPPELPHFTGRHDHVARIHQALTGQTRPGLSLVTVTGMAGVGKTTLAVQAAHTLRPDFPDGRLHADLRGADLVPASPSDILADFLTTLGVRPEAVPKDLPGRSALFRTTTADKRLLLLLDNARDDAQVQPLLPGSPDCAVLVTSRTMLSSVPSVLHLALDVFSKDEAISLLDSVIGTARRAAQNDQAELLVEACGRLPLAVRIAAAQLVSAPHRPIGDLVRRLADDRVGITALRTRTVAIEQVFELGYLLLEPPLATAFRKLSWVEPDIGLASAAAVLGLPDDQAERLAESLVDQALLESTAPGRYRFHDLVRAFARRTSLRRGPAERAAARQRLLTLLLGRARTAFALAVPGDPVAEVFGGALPARPVFKDLPHARRWARTDTPAAIALAAAVATDARANANAPTAPTPDTAEATETAELRSAIDLLIALSPLGLGAFGGRAEEAARLLIAAAVERGDRAAEGRSRFLLGTVLLARARLDEAGDQARRAARACQEAGDRAVLRQALNDLGLIAQAEGRHEEAIAAFDESAALARRLGHRSGEVASTANAALSRIRSGHAAEAAATCRRLLAEPADNPTATADAGMTAYVHYVLGLAYQVLDRLDDAAAQLRSCIDRAGPAGDLDRESAARSRLADVLRLLGRVDEAVQHAERALALATKGGRQRERALAHLVLANAMTARGDHAAARQHEEQAHLLLGPQSAGESAVATLLPTAPTEPAATARPVTPPEA
ncbi:BTAD domain-containing putative transcriptional regulator [Streptomyces sp. 1114.5]|uniref:AfsR/SARP family transcriptional regulator n=1 Tax=Streptomyces sp. 1114.5 TaxID=1938830 RepID=UPI00217EF146|nr:BTAD domain-containing putative transcriptional regulator [Streptomyces sp. 1114.5]